MIPIILYTPFSPRPVWTFFFLEEGNYIEVLHKREVLKWELKYRENQLRFNKYLLLDSIESSNAIKFKSVLGSSHDI